LLPTVIGCSFFYKLEAKSKIILLLVLAACVPQLARALLGRTSLLNIFYNINIGIELLLLFLFFRGRYSPGTRSVLFNTLAIISIISGFVSIIVMGLESKFLTEWLCINNITYTAWILMLIFDLYERDKDLLEIRRPFMLYLIGLFFYSSCTILIFSLWSYLMANKDSYLRNLWIIHDVFNTFMYTAFSFGFLLEIRNSYSKKSLY
jgi:hypothetical protein